MTYSELFPTTAGLFTTIFKVNFPIDYATLFKDIDTQELDLMANLLYGDKTIISKITETNKVEYINAIINIRLSSWLKAENLLSLTYDVTKPINITDTKIGTVNIENSDLNTNTDSKKAFNDTDFTDSERTTDTAESTKTESTNFENIRSGSDGSHNVTDYIQKEIEFRQNVFTAEIIRNITDYITLKVY